MAGLQTHMDSPLPAVRETGMTVGESLMNRLNPTLSEEQKLRFEYSSSEDIQALLRLARWVPALVGPYLMPHWIPAVGTGSRGCDAASAGLSCQASGGTGERAEGCLQDLAGGGAP